MSDSSSPLSDEFLEFLSGVQGKRARIVVEHILEHGFITTEELESLYGYNHPPRAIRDVREQGVPIETFKVKNAQGRTIAAYRFGQKAALEPHKSGGRRPLPRSLKHELILSGGPVCAICHHNFAENYLQIDHRIPYEIKGDQGLPQSIASYMLVCASCNRLKSWTCEHCENWQTLKDETICQTCYWANPQQYQHIAMLALRRLDITWSGENETDDYDRLQALADQNQQSLAEYIKALLRQHLASE